MYNTCNGERKENSRFDFRNDTGISWSHRQARLRKASKLIHRSRLYLRVPNKLSNIGNMKQMLGLTSVMCDIIGSLLKCLHDTNFHLSCGFITESMSRWRLPRHAQMIC